MLSVNIVEYMQNLWYNKNLEISFAKDFYELIVANYYNERP